VAEDIKGRTSAILSRFGIIMSPSIYQAVSAEVSFPDHIVEAVEDLPVKKSKKNKI
jgi:hypothetical protein